jgi:hypothetical protein
MIISPQGLWASTRPLRPGQIGQSSRGSAGERNHAPFTLKPLEFFQVLPEDVKCRMNGLK